MKIPGYIADARTAARNRQLSLYMPVDFIDELAAAESIDEILQVVARWFRQMFDADRVSIALPSDTAHLRLVALEDKRAIDIDTLIPIKGTMVGRVFRKAHAEICNGLASSTDRDCLILASSGLGSCLDAPLTSGSHCYGTLNVARRRPDAFCAQDQRKLEVLAMWIATLVRVHRQVERLTHISETDPLTRIMNRRAFTDRFRMRCRDWSRRKATLGFAVIDIDHFKRINDTHGHDVGDLVLVYLGKMLSEFFREGDLVARFGGEEFCVLMQDVNEANLLAALERFRVALGAARIRHLQGELSITASIGAVLVLKPEIGLDKIFISADAALYEAKGAGRNRVQLAAAMD